MRMEYQDRETLHECLLRCQERIARAERELADVRKFGDWQHWQAELKHAQSDAAYVQHRMGEAA